MSIHNWSVRKNVLFAACTFLVIAYVNYGCGCSETQNLFASNLVRHCAHYVSLIITQINEIFFILKWFTKYELFFSATPKEFHHCFKSLNFSSIRSTLRVQSVCEWFEWPHNIPLIVLMSSLKCIVYVLIISTYMYIIYMAIAKTVCTTDYALVVWWYTSLYHNNSNFECCCIVMSISTKDIYIYIRPS